MTDVLHVQTRDEMGTAATRRLRRSGRIPAVLYGHGEGNQHLSVSSGEVEMLLRHHSKAVQLDGATNVTALISDMQWDPLGIEVLHLDLIRVNLQEKVDVSVPIHRHGDAIGTREGGVLIENLHEVEVRCSAGAIPESIGLNVNDLHVGQHVTAADLELPEGVELLTDPETVVAHVERLHVEEEVGEVPAGGEPEVISRGAEGEQSAAE